MRKTAVGNRKSEVGWARIVLLLFALLPTSYFLLPLFSQQFSLSGQYVSSGKVSTAAQSGAILFSDGFESGSFSAWTGHNTNWNVEVNGANPHGGTYAGEYWYTICSDSGDQAATTGSNDATYANPGVRYFKYVYKQLSSSWQNVLGSSEGTFTVTSGNGLKVASPASGKAFHKWDVYVGTASGDANLYKQNASALDVGTDWVQTGPLLTSTAYPGSFVGCPGGSWTRQSWQSISAAQSHFFARAYVYFKSPESGGTKDGVARKLFWFNDAGTDWSTILTTSASAGVIKFTHGTQDSGAPGCTVTAANAFVNQGSIDWDTWYSVEEEIRLNTPGQANGIVRLWVNGDLVAENTSFNHRGDCTSDMAGFSLGFQSNVSAGTRVDEKRYWDDVVISDSYIGP